MEFVFAAWGLIPSLRRVTGWLADFFRFAWGLLYWNTRKTWFRRRRGQARCPCQSPSDSGRAFETTCEASLTWHDQARFRRVCPLLVSTKDGLRCSANTADVRPFWGRFWAYYGGTAAALYLTAVLVVFVFLRSVGYPISIVHLAWPGSWHRVGEVRGWFFMERANRAFAAGRPAEGMLYLTNSYQFDPTNYQVGLTLAQKLQLNSPARADEIYQRLLAEHPDRRTATARLWFRSLLARGNFQQIGRLAMEQVTADPADASVWMRALIFATRQSGEVAPLSALRASTSPAAAPWRTVLDCELSLRSGKKAAALARLGQPWDDAGGYALFYQIDTLIDLDRAFDAVDRLESYGRRLDDVARATLHLEAYARLGAAQSLERFVDMLLAPEANTPTFTLLTAHLVRHPNRAVLDRVYAKFMAARIPLNGETLPAYLSLYCAAGAGGDWTKLQAIAGLIKREAGGTSYTLGLAEAFLRAETTQTRIAGLLAALPMPLELHYALLERYPGPRPVRAAAP